MGQGYWIIVHDGWGAGLVMINPRMYQEGYDYLGNPANWWPCKADESEHELAKRHDLSEFKYHVVVKS